MSAQGNKRHFAIELDRYYWQDNLVKQAGPEFKSQLGGDCDQEQWFAMWDMACFTFLSRTKTLSCWLELSRSWELPVASWSVVRCPPCFLLTCKPSGTWQLQSHCNSKVLFLRCRDIPNMTGHSPGQPALGNPAWAGGLDQVTSRGPCQPQPVCDSVS